MFWPCDLENMQEPPKEERRLEMRGGVRMGAGLVWSLCVRHPRQFRGRWFKHGPVPHLRSLPWTRCSKSLCPNMGHLRLEWNECLLNFGDVKYSRLRFGIPFEAPTMRDL